MQISVFDCVDVYLVCYYILLFGAHASMILFPHRKMLEVRFGRDFASERRQSLAGKFEITLSFRPLFKKILDVIRMDEIEFFVVYIADFSMSTPMGEWDIPNIIAPCE